MKIAELRALNSQELSQKEKGLKKELFDLNYQRRLGQVEKPSRFRSIHKSIAQILTILKERELEEAKNGTSKTRTKN